MFIVEGNIGAGKTTFLKLISQNFSHISVVFEPLHNWQNKVYGQSLLTNFYKEPKRWAYTMETLAMICRVQEHLKEQTNTNPFRLMERSIYSGHYCFAKNDYQNGFLSEMEWKVYLQWFDFLIPNHCKAPKGFIYLKVSPEIAYERIKKRKRLAEKNITLSYLKHINTCHEEFLISKKSVLEDIQKTPVLILDCNEEFESNLSQFENHAKAVEQFIIENSL